MSVDSVLALIPAWNEAKRIRPVLEGALAHLPVLVVDDGSVDDTGRVAESAGAAVIRHGVNQGKGAALMTGFRWALHHGYEAVLTLDADGQHDPGDIPKFLDAYASDGGDLIVGQRDFAQMPFPRRHTNPFGSWLLSLALGTTIYDNQSGYRLYTRRVLEAFEPSSVGFELEVEVIVQAVRDKMHIGWVPVRTIYGTGKRSYFRPIRDSARFLKTVWLARRHRASRPPAELD